MSNQVTISCLMVRCLRTQPLNALVYYYYFYIKFESNNKSSQVLYCTLFNGHLFNAHCRPYPKTTRPSQHINTIKLTTAILQTIHLNPLGITLCPTAEWKIGKLPNTSRPITVCNASLVPQFTCNTHPIGLGSASNANERMENKVP